MDNDAGGAFAAAGLDESVSARADRPILIAVPFYKNEHLVQPVIGSLIRCATEMRRLGCEAVFYDDSPGYPPLGHALDAMLPASRAAFPCRIERNPENLGFVRTMNHAVAEAVSRGMDLLLLNSDTAMEPGALTEMTACLRIDHMIGFVNPRSNNATIATLPIRVGADATQTSYLEHARRLTDGLPRASYIPTAIGFCLLIRWSVLAEFGGFDEIYGRGYNEENDLVMRAGRCGYRAVMANHAFVWHEGERSFATSDMDRSVWEPANRAILDARYPEYGGHTACFYHSPETIAETLLGRLLPGTDGRLDLGFDFSSFRAAHNGTFQAGEQLLNAPVWQKHFRVWVICSEDVYRFHGYADQGIPRCDPHEGRTFAAIFRVGQPYDWNVLQRLAIAAPVIGIYMLDTISIDCPQLASARLYNLWQFAIDHTDLIVMQSQQTKMQFNARFRFPPETAQAVSRHSVSLKDYVLPVRAPRPASESGRPISVRPGAILVIGNHFHHKYLHQTVNALAARFPDRDIVAMGAPQAAQPGMRSNPSDPVPLQDLPNLRPLPVGRLANEEIGFWYMSCAMVVFPSHAEGFGFPLLNALAARRPVFVRRLPVFLELWETLGRSPNIHFYESTRDLLDALAEPPSWLDEAPGRQKQDATRNAVEIRDLLLAATVAADYQRIVRRVRAVQFASDVSDSHASPAQRGTPAAQVAHFMALRVERLARRVLSIPPIYRSARAVFRTARRGAATIGWRS